MRGRPSKAAKAKAAKPKISAATEARANAFLDREAMLDEAVNRGVIGANLRGHYAACFDADPQGTRSYLQALGLPARAAATQAAADEYVDTHLTPQERKSIAAAREGKRPRINHGGL
jgi:hypothetical protein